MYAYLLLLQQLLYFAHRNFSLKADLILTHRYLKKKLKILLKEIDVIPTNFKPKQTLAESLLRMPKAATWIMLSIMAEAQL